MVAVGIKIKWILLSLHLSGGTKENRMLYFRRNIFRAQDRRLRPPAKTRSPYQIFVGETQCPILIIRLTLILNVAFKVACISYIPATRWGVQTATFIKTAPLERAQTLGNQKESYKSYDNSMLLRQIHKIRSQYTQSDRVQAAFKCAILHFGIV